MFKLVLATLFALSTTPTIQEVANSNSQITVTFELFAPRLNNDSSVFITGSLTELGNWNPGKIQMKSLGDHRWSYQITTRPDYPIEYKYTLGSWAKEGADARGKPLANFAIRPAEDAVIKDQIQFWTDGTTKVLEGQITGTVKYHRQLELEGLLPRDIVVWLPPDYEQSTDRFPVLYMHDGQNLFDPKTSAFGTDWQIDEICTELIGSGKIEPIIVVGIYNTPQRSRDYLPGRQGDLYAKFICTKLKPFIDRSYRTNHSRDATSIGGSSAGGICAFRIAWTNPDVFSKAICMSPSFQYQRADGNLAVDYVAEFANSTTPAKIPFFYIDNGGVGLEEILQPGIDAMLLAMKNKGLIQGDKSAPGSHFCWKKFPDARHDESAWAKRMPAVLQMLYSR